MDIAGHVSKQMLKHYSHIRMEAKRDALEAILQKKPTQAKQSQTPEAPQNQSPTPTIAKRFEAESLQKSLQSGYSEGHRGYGGPLSPRKEMAPQVGLEPTTLRLTAGCSAIELLRSVVMPGRHLLILLNRCDSG
jgi:hypothetical protein